MGTCFEMLRGFFQENSFQKLIFVRFHGFVCKFLRIVEDPCRYVGKNRFVVLCCFCDIRWSILIVFLLWHGGDIGVGCENYFLPFFKKEISQKNLRFVEVQNTKTYGRNFR
jgi:hypothetical protein